MVRDVMRAPSCRPPTDITFAFAAFFGYGGGRKSIVYRCQRAVHCEGAIHMLAAQLDVEQHKNTVCIWQALLNSDRGSCAPFEK